MANKIKSKGTALLMDISSTFTAIPQLTDISISGEKSETYDSTTLDGGAFKTKDPTGYVEPCTITAGCFYDPQNAVHAAFIALIAAPAAKDFKITYTDAGPTSATYSGTGFGFDKTVAAADGVKGSFTIETSGAPS